MHSELILEKIAAFQATQRNDLISPYGSFQCKGVAHPHGHPEGSGSSNTDSVELIVTHAYIPVVLQEVEGENRRHELWVREV